MPVVSGETTVCMSRSVAQTALPANVAGLSMTILDGHVSGQGKFSHRLGTHRNAWIHAIDGDLRVSVEGSLQTLKHGEALTVSSPANGPAAEIVLQSDTGKTSHFALFDAEPLDEPYVQQGPLVMGSPSEIEMAQAAYAAGRFGSID
jgi:redox-sensitive bicupin YhaK (pirin superfamily)